ncbi:MAG: GH92 family glycosyl hydrolase, partial [Pontiellaceae bacterium]|nr:GH92 family glycosyl hydrolase [Pontiellaceae bacterium]
MRIRTAFILTAATVNLCFGAVQSQEDVLNYVDPMIGTDGKGHTFPGATTPQGMIQLSPSDGDYFPGYHYRESVIKGFAHNHFSGTGLGGMGDILLMPTSGKLQMEPGTKEDPDTGYRSRFSHEREVASPGYYSVWLDDYSVKAELTATKRVGFHRYTFSKAGEHHVILDPTHGVRESINDAEVEILSDTEVRGSRWSHGACGNRKVFFYAKFSKPFTAYGVSEYGKVIPGARRANTLTARAFVSFEGCADETVETAVALSYVDPDGARENYDAEGKDKTFEEVHQAARSMWRNKIARITVEDESEAVKRIFYTALYHSFIAPNTISDATGNYVIEGNVYFSPHLEQVSNISTWDTYRATHPLWTLIDQKADAHLVNVLLSRYTQSGTGLSLWEALGHDNFCMVGYSGISVIADAVLKNLPGIDEELAYDCVRKAAFSKGRCSPNYGRNNGVAEYLKLGYVPAEIGCSVSKTMEYCYYDWCIAEMAKKLGKPDDEALFRKRSQGYRNLYHPEKKFMWPRFADGSWQPMDHARWDGLKRTYISGNIWGYSGYTPHDMDGAMALFGGRENYADWLDEVFTKEIRMAGHPHWDISGFIGGYAHGDEPGHQMPYSFVIAGRPWRTQEIVRQIMTTFYSDRPDGYVNNEDCGQMSSWFVFSAMGFYPVCPGSPDYILGAPLVDRAEIHLENGNTFTIRALNNSQANQYVQSVFLNGNPHDRRSVSHDEIMRGGELVFE